MKWLSFVFLFLCGSALATQNIDIPTAAWKSPVASVAALPSGGNNLGDARVAEDTFNVYVWNGSTWQTAGGSGSVTSVSVVSANGLAGTVATATTTPAITLSTTITGLLKGNGTAISAQTTGDLTDAGTDGIVVTSGSGAVLGSGTSLAQHVADASHNGYLSYSDWSTFNGKQAAGTYIKADGSVDFSANQSMASHKLTNVTDPTSAQDAATKSYVDTQLLQLNPADAVYAASIATVPGTYVNAVGGVCIGDTFTTTATTAFALDGTSPPVGARVLFKDQTSAFQRGVWTLTTQAVGGVSGAVLTRALDSDSAADFNSGQIVPIINGTVNAGASYFQTATISTCNSDSQTWTQFQKASSAYASSTLTNTHLFVGNSSAVATDVALSQDCTLANTGAITCTKTNNVSFATSATTDTTNASNITSGTHPVNTGGTGQTTYTNGQLLIGNTSGNTLTKATLTQGSGITITNGTGSITIAATGGSAPSFSTSTLTSSTTLATGTFYAFDATSASLTETLPDATASAGGQIIGCRKDASVFGVTIAAAGSDTFNGGSTAFTLIDQNKCFTIMSIGALWFIVN